VGGRQPVRVAAVGGDDEGGREVGEALNGNAVGARDKEEEALALRFIEPVDDLGFGVGLGLGLGFGGLGIGGVGVGLGWGWGSG